MNATTISGYRYDKTLERPCRYCHGRGCQSCFGVGFVCARCGDFLQELPRYGCIKGHGRVRA